MSIHNIFTVPLAEIPISVRMELIVHKKSLMILLPILYVTITLSIANAATITNCTFDKDTYHQGQTGYIAVTLYNDKEDKIKITELTANIDYHYADGTTYIQTFFTDATLPLEIPQGQTDRLYIPFSLPTNIAPGYTELYVRAKTELWHNQSGDWLSSEYPTYRPTIYIESPYQQQYVDQLVENEGLQDQIQQLQTINNTTANLMYLLGITTIIFAAVAVLFIFLSRRASVINQPIR